MSTLFECHALRSGKTGPTRLSCRARALPEQTQPGDGEKGLSRFKRFLRHGINHHDDAIADPGRQLLKVVPRTLVDKGSRDIAAERQRANELSASLRSNVKRHDDAIAASGKQIKRLPSVKGLVDKGMQDIQTVATRSTQGAPLSEYSEIWTFPIALVTYSTMVIVWAAELAGMCRFPWCRVRSTGLSCP